MPSCLLETVQGLIERTYAMRRLPRVERFIVGDEGYRRFGLDAAAQSVGAGDADGARTLVRETEAGLRCAIYYPDDVIRRLEAHPPQQGLNEENVEAFATFVEELDHLLLIAERVECQRPVTLFELELHANVTKHLVLARFLVGKRRQLSEQRRRWLARELFEAGEFCDPDPEVRQRYRDAGRWAVRLLGALRPLGSAARVAALRAFHAADTGGKLELIGRLT
ncbi:MAG TPA: hypothetical protein VJS92_07450 [Candidatus Polarisedimenticolaceae bacterium]|nr:hypothetical protein [Candidatus Polarisedimenticolaceae bacterium]